jgi:endonuclease III
MAAKEFVINSGFAKEVDWQYNLSFSGITESDFLRETAWVILSAGMRESVVRKKFSAISEAFYEWITAEQITTHKSACKTKAMTIFGNERKIDSIIKIAEIVYQKGFDEVRNSIEFDGVKFIQLLPYMGPATSYHLAKNLGLSVVKPDRHLLRVARRTGYRSPEDLCQAIAKIVGDKVSVIDLVIWRYATLERDYLQHFCQFSV